MYECSQCGKSGKKLWLSKNGLCEKCAWKVYSGLSIHAKEALQRGLSPLDPDYEERLEALEAKPMGGVMLARPPKKIKPLYKTWWVYALVGLIIASIALVIILTRPPATNEERLNMGMPMPDDGDAMGEIMFEEAEGWG